MDLGRNLPLQVTIDLPRRLDRPVAPQQVHDTLYRSSHRRSYSLDWNGFTAWRVSRQSSLPAL